eukprot:2582666-Rhodomonas_salina.1
MSACEPSARGAAEDALEQEVHCVVATGAPLLPLTRPTEGFSSEEDEACPLLSETSLKDEAEAKLFEELAGAIAKSCWAAHSFNILSDQWLDDLKTQLLQIKAIALGRVTISIKGSMEKGTYVGGSDVDVLIDIYNVYYFTVLCNH